MLGGKKILIEFHAWNMRTHTRTAVRGLRTQWIIYWEMFQTVTQSHTHTKSTEYWHVSVSVHVWMWWVTRQQTAKKNHTKKRKHIEFHSIGSFDGNSKKHSARGAIHRYFWAEYNTSAFEMFTCTISIYLFFSKKKSTSNYFCMLIFSHCHCPSVQYMSINFNWRRRKKLNKQTNYFVNHFPCGERIFHIVRYVGYIFSIFSHLLRTITCGAQMLDGDFIWWLFSLNLHKLMMMMMPTTTMVFDIKRIFQYTRRVEWDAYCVCEREKNVINCQLLSMSSTYQSQIFEIGWTKIHAFERRTFSKNQKSNQSWDYLYRLSVCDNNTIGLFHFNRGHIDGIVPSINARVA